MVTVLSKADCVQCIMTTNLLTKLGIPFQERDMTKDLDALAEAKKLGYLSAPVVIRGDDHWSGFQPERIKALA